MIQKFVLLMESVNLWMNVNAIKDGLKIIAHYLPVFPNLLMKLLCVVEMEIVHNWMIVNAKMDGQV